MPLASCSIISLAGRCGGASIKPWPSTVTGNGINAKPVRKLNCRTKSAVVCLGRLGQNRNNLLGSFVSQAFGRFSRATQPFLKRGRLNQDAELAEAAIHFPPVV